MKKKRKSVNYNHNRNNQGELVKDANYLSSSSSSLTEKLISLFLYVKNCLILIVTGRIMMMMLSSAGGKDNDGGGGGGDQLLSSKKEAKLRNKQNKLMAEYRLVTGKGEEGGDDVGGSGSGGKKRKLDDGGGGKDGGGGRKMLNEKEFKAMKMELAERKRALMNLPRFKITQSSGLQASVFLQEYATRAPLLLSDIQHLVTYAYGGNDLVPPPSRWCHLQKSTKLLQIVVLVVDGVGLNEFVDNEERFGRMMGVFGGEVEENRGIFEVLDPKWYGDSVFGEVGRWGIVGAGISNNNNDGEGGCNQDQVTVKEEKKVKVEVKEEEPVAAEGPPPPSVQNFEPIMNQLRSVFPISIKNKPKSTTDKAEHPSTDTFPRTALVLTLPQLIHENYPLPIPANTLTRNTKTGYTLTSEGYAPVTPNSKMYSIDCEMCEAVGDPNALIRIGIIDEELGTVYESLVKPKGKIMDYRTRWSGVSKEMMEGVETSLEDVQEKLREIVEMNPGCILVGQSLNCDLKAMKILHPYVIDTSTIFNLTGIAGRKSSLKDLSLNLLDEIIQNKDPKQINASNGQPLQGHCPVEDARAAMKLVKAKLANGYSFGNNMKTSGGSGIPAGDDASTLVAFEDPLVKNKLLSSAGNKLTKDVLIVTQEDSDNFPFTSNQHATPANNKDSANDSATTAKSSQPIIPTQITPNKTTVKSTTTNGNTIKLMYTHFLESFLTVGFYKLNEESEDFGKTLGKLDKRVEKLFNRMCPNSMLVVVGCGGNSSSSNSGEGKGSSKNGGSESERKNNGICFVRVKVDDMVKRRRKD